MLEFGERALLLVFLGTRRLAVTEVEFFEPVLGHLARRTHEQVLCVLVERECGGLRMLGSSASIMTIRPTPGAIPGWGGAP